MRWEGIVWIAGAALSCVGCGGAASDAPMRVLFVGNSRIYYHNQPAMLEAVAAANGRPISTSMVAEGGASLGDLIADGVLDTIRSTPWDVVIVNEQSTWGLARYVDGASRVPPAPARFFDSVDSLASAAERSGATLVLLAHARQRHMPVEDGDRLLAGFAEAGARHPSAVVVPLESAWRAAGEDRLDDLYDPDGNHPSPTGALVQVLSVYRALFDEMPAVVPDTIMGPLVDHDDGSVLADSIVELVTVDDDLMRFLSAIVEGGWSGWSRDVARAQEAAHNQDGPTLPSPSEPIELSALQGTWRGTVRTYPRFLPWPASMELSIRGGDAPTTSLEISFGGSPSDIVYPVLPVSDEGAYIQFVDPDGPNGGFIRYRLVPVGDSLIGISEFTSDGVYGIGSVALGRSR